MSHNIVTYMLTQLLSTVKSIPLIAVKKCDLFTRYGIVTDLIYKHDFKKNINSIFRQLGAVSCKLPAKSQVIPLTALIPVNNIP